MGGRPHGQLAIELEDQTSNAERLRNVRKDLERYPHVVVLTKTKRQATTLTKALTPEQEQRVTIGTTTDYKRTITQALSTLATPKNHQEPTKPAPPRKETRRKPKRTAKQPAAKPEIKRKPLKPTSTSTKGVDQTPNAEHPEVMTAKQAAAYVGLSPATLATKRTRGGGPPYAKRGRILYRKEDLDRWLEEAKRRSTSDS